MGFYCTRDVVADGLDFFSMQGVRQNVANKVKRTPDQIKLHIRDGDEKWETSAIDWSTWREQDVLVATKLDDSEFSECPDGPERGLPGTFVLIKVVDDQPKKMHNRNHQLVLLLPNLRCPKLRLLYPLLLLYPPPLPVKPLRTHRHIPQPLHLQLVPRHVRPLRQLVRDPSPESRTENRYRIVNEIQLLQERVTGMLRTLVTINPPAVRFTPIITIVIEDTEAEVERKILIKRDLQSQR